MKQKLTLLLISFLACTSHVAAQEFTVKGQIVSVTDGEPIEGVSVSVKNAKSDVETTDKDGNYRIKINLDAYADVFYYRKSGPELVFVHPEYRVLEVPIKSRTTIDVVLRPAAIRTSNEILTGTAVGQAPKLLSYSVGCVEERMIGVTPTTTNFGTSLQGKVPGLRVNQIGGLPGQGVFFQVRSANAIANGQRPLILVDGIYLNGSNLADINPEDIDRIEVLKGSVGTSIYGSQAANGVIQIFTKRGEHIKAGETIVTYRGEIGASEPVDYLPLNEFTNREVLNASGPQPVLGNPTPDNLHNTPLPNLQNYQEDILFRRGIMYSNGLTVQSKFERTKLFASAQRLEDEGMIQGTEGYTRNSVRLNLDHQVSDRFDLRLSSMYSSSEQNLVDPAFNPAEGYMATALLMTPIFDLESANEEDGSPFDWDIDNTGSSAGRGITNPLYVRSNSTSFNNRTRLLGGLTAQYKLNDWMTLDYVATLDRSTNEFMHFLEKGYLSPEAPGAFGSMATAVFQQSNGGGIHLSTRSNNYFTSRANVNLKKAFGNFNTALRGSFIYENQLREFNEGIGENLTVSDIRSLNNTQSNARIASEEEEIVARSGFLVADLDFKNKYIFSGLFRREGSSLFGPEERWSNYYRVSAAYRVTEDLKIKGVQELKFRGSMGTAGVQPTFEQRFETFDLTNGNLSKNTLGNNFLRPSQSKEIEVGVDASFWNAFTLEFNYSMVNTTDQILLVPLTAAFGFRNQWRNAGTVEATVYEGRFDIDFAKMFKIKNKGVNWNVTASFDRVEQEITELDVPSYVTGPDQQQSLFLIEAGRPLGVMVGEVFATDLSDLGGVEGIDPSNFSINDAGYVVRNDLLGTPEEVPYKVVDSNGNPVVREIGNINPDYRIGISHFFEFKGFQLFALVDWKVGGDVYNLTKQWLYRDQRSADVSAYPNVAASFYGNNGLYNNLVANNHFVEDGSFVTLREASIAMTFQKKNLQKLFKNFINKIRISLTGRNLFTITDYTGFHPDITSVPRDENTLLNNMGNGVDEKTPNGDPNLFVVDAFNYPLSRFVSFGMQVTF